MLQSERLRRLRTQNNLTLERLAEMLDLSMRQVVRYEAGEADPASDVVSHLADIFNVTADYLLGRTDDPTPLYKNIDLTPKEQAVLAALRRGEPMEAIKVIVADS